MRLILPVAELAVSVLGVDGRKQVDEEGEDVECENECDRPLENGSGVIALFEVAGAEGDCEADFEEDEAELDPEGCAEDAVFTVFCGLLVPVEM